MGLAAQQKLFTAEEVCSLLGITREDLQFLAGSRHIGHRTEETADEKERVFDRNDLAVLAVLSAQLSRGEF